KPEESRLVLLPEGKDKPPMPPKKAKQPKAPVVAVLRAWVAAGAKDDSATVVVRIPDIKPRVPSPPPVTALSYRPDGKLLAAGVHRSVIFIDPASGDVAGELPFGHEKVTALAFSPDGRRLAAASSKPGAAAEVFLYVLSQDLSAMKPER